MFESNERTKGDPTGAPSQLRVEKLTLSFGGVTALSKISFDLRRHEILAIIGPNGAGKTGLLNCISGFYKPQEGDIYLNNKRITHLPAYKRAAIGISRTFQNMQLYSGLTALENLMAAIHIHLNPGLISSACFFGRARRNEIQHRKIVEEIIDFMEIESIRHKVVGSLAYGQRKQVDLARALALEPSLLLLDEPMAGLNVEEKEDMARFIEVGTRKSYREVKHYRRRKRWLS